MQSNDVVKTYMVVTGRNDKKVYHDSDLDIDIEEYTLNPAFTNIKFPDDFVNSTNRRFITVMPPKIIFGDDERKQFDNQYIMHCSFIYRDPYHEKACMPVNIGRRSKYKKYEYKANYDTFDITFTHNQPNPYSAWRILQDNLTEEQIKEKISDLYGDDVLQEIQDLVDDWDDQGITDGTEITKETEKIVPTFDCFGLGGYRTDRNFPPFTKAKTYIYQEIWAYAYWIICVDDINLFFGPIKSTEGVGDDDMYYIQESCICHEDVFGYFFKEEGVAYKLLEKDQPWSYYAEFMLQY